MSWHKRTTAPGESNSVWRANHGIPKSPPEIIETVTINADESMDIVTALYDAHGIKRINTTHLCAAIARHLNTKNMTGATIVDRRPGQWQVGNTSYQTSEE